MQYIIIGCIGFLIGGFHGAAIGILAFVALCVLLIIIGALTGI